MFACLILISINTFGRINIGNVISVFHLTNWSKIPNIFKILFIANDETLKSDDILLNCFGEETLRAVV